MTPSVHPCLHPIWHLQTCQLNMIQTSKLGGVILPFVEGYSPWTKNWGHPLTCFLHVNGILFFGKNIQRWCHLVHASNFIPIAHANLHNIWFIAQKKQHDVLRQVIVKNFTMVYCSHDVHECPCQLYTISPKGNKSCLPIHIRPPLL